MSIDVRGIVDAACIASQSVDAGNDGRGYAGAAEDQPAGLIVCIIHRDPGTGIGYCRDIGHSAHAAPFVLLPARLGDVDAAPAARAAPDGFFPPAFVARVEQGGATHRGQSCEYGWITNVGIATIAGTGGDSNAGMREVLLFDTDFAALLVAAIAVALRVSTQLHRLIDGGTQIEEMVGRRFNQDDMTVGANGANHIEVQRDFLGPA